MTTGTLAARLDPARSPNISPPMAAMLGFLLGRTDMTPALAERVVTPDGHVVGRAEGDFGLIFHHSASVIPASGVEKMEPDRGGKSMCDGY